MTQSSKHFFRTVKRLAKKALRKPTRKCKCKTQRRHRSHHRCSRRTHRRQHKQRGGELFSNPLYSEAIVPMKTEEGISIFRTASQAKDELVPSVDVSYDADVELQEPLPTNNNTKKLKNNFSPNMYNQPEIENAEL
jgi:hypothetical protein